VTSQLVREITEPRLIAESGKPAPWGRACEIAGTVLGCYFRKITSESGNYEFAAGVVLPTVHAKDKSDCGTTRDCKVADLAAE
jgi:hypothetical protein